MVVLGVACGLLLLTRADLAGFGLAAAVAIVVTVGFGRALAFIGITGLVSLPWSVLSWFWLGSAVPDTMVIKLGESMGDRTFANGLYYFFEAYPFAVTASLIPPAIGVLVLLGGWRRAVAPLHLVLGVGGLLHAGTYLLLNTAPYQWYYGPAIGALTMLGAVGAPRAALRTVALGASVATVAVTAVYLVARPWTLTTISGNWATPTEYRALAERAPAGAVVQSFGEVGTVAYYCACTVTDRLSDRGWFAEILAQQEAAAGPFERALLDLNYRNFHTARAAAPRSTSSRSRPTGPACPRPPGAATRGRWSWCRSDRQAAEDRARDVAQRAHHEPQRRGAHTSSLRVRTASTTTAATASGVVDSGAGFRPSVIRVCTNPGRTTVTCTPTGRSASVSPE